MNIQHVFHYFFVSEIFQVDDFVEFFIYQQLLILGSKLFVLLLLRPVECELQVVLEEVDLILLVFRQLLEDLLIEVECDEPLVAVKEAQAAEHPNDEL